MTLLCDLAYKYGSDKCPAIKHHFTEYYYDLFKDRRETVKKVVELGIGEGASLRMWRDFFPNAQIYGIDILPEALVFEDRIESYQCDQADGWTLLEAMIGVGFSGIGTDIDLFVEDGSHKPEEQIYTCLTVMRYLPKSSLYVIEDIGHPEIADCIAMAGYAVDIIKFPHRRYNDDRLIAVRHKNA